MALIKNYMKKKTIIKKIEAYKKDKKAPPGTLISKMNEKKRVAIMGLV